jgi:hypothetical protein
MPKENKRPIDENSPNLVTLMPGQARVLTQGANPTTSEFTIFYSGVEVG